MRKNRHMVTTAHPIRPGERLQLKLELQDVQPTIWRRLAVPRSAKLLQLHRIIQITMGWEDRHQHEFDFAGRRYGTPDPE
jgi:hypothetical protein